MCKIGEVVVVGGVRRSAMISLSNINDIEMAQAKSGNWWENKTIPKKNYRSNSKICKTCPLQKECAIAEVGDIKIASLEELSETM